MTNELNVIDILKDVRSRDDKSASKYLESEHKDFSIYSITSRAIPLFAGLKPVQQRCLWQLRGVSKYEKVAKLTGMVMSIHPHGDCLEYNTEVLLSDGHYIKIGDWVENNPETELSIKAFDREKQEFVTTVAKPTNGKITDELIEITFENGAIIKSSLYHKFLLEDGVNYIDAKDLTENMSIKSF